MFSKVRYGNQWMTESSFVFKYLDNLAKRLCKNYGICSLKCCILSMKDITAQYKRKALLPMYKKYCILCTLVGIVANGWVSIQTMVH